MLAGTEGLERALTHARLQLRRLVVPDENATWALTAIPAAIRLVREHGIDAVVSTSPPGSTHLIAAASRAPPASRWVADLRDSLVAHAHRRADTTATQAKAAMHAGSRGSSRGTLTRSPASPRRSPTRRARSSRAGGS